MLSLSNNNQVDVIEAFNSTSRYLDGFLNNINSYFEQIVGQIYSTALQLNKANFFDTESPSVDLSILTNGMVASKIYDKWDDYNFEIVNSPFLGGDVPRYPSYGVYISRHIRFARVYFSVSDFANIKTIYFQCKHHSFSCLNQNYFNQCGDNILFLVRDRIDILCIKYFLY